MQPILQQLRSFQDISNRTLVVPSTNGYGIKCMVFNGDGLKKFAAGDQANSVAFVLYTVIPLNASAFNLKAAVSLYEPENLGTVTGPITLERYQTSLQGRPVNYIGLNSEYHLGWQKTRTKDVNGNVLQTQYLLSLTTLTPDTTADYPMYLAPEFQTAATAAGYAIHVTSIRVTLLTPFVQTYAQTRIYGFNDWLSNIGGTIGLIGTVFGILFPAIRSWQRQSVVSSYCGHRLTKKDLDNIDNQQPTENVDDLNRDLQALRDQSGAYSPGGASKI